MPAGAAGVAPVLPGGLSVVRRRAGGATGTAASDAAAEEGGVPAGARAGGGDGAAGQGEVRQDDCLPGEAGAPAGQDQQPRGAGQPAVAVRGEGAVQVAFAAVAGPLPASPPGATGRAVGPSEAATPPGQPAAPVRPGTGGFSRWGLARSVYGDRPGRLRPTVGIRLSAGGTGSRSGRNNLPPGAGHG